MVAQIFSDEAVLKLDSNPLHWTVRDVIDFLKTTDCASLARVVHDQVSVSTTITAVFRFLFTGFGFQIVCTFGWYGDGAGNTAEENSSVFSLIRMR